MSDWRRESAAGPRQVQPVENTAKSRSGWPGADVATRQPALVVVRCEPPDENTAKSRSRWPFADVEEAAGSSPSDGGQPALGEGDHAGVRRRRGPMRPSVEPRAGAARVDAGRRAEVLAEVEQDVREGPSDLGGRRQGSRVIAVGPDGTSAVPAAVHGAGTAAGEALHASRERPRRIRLDDEVEVVALKENWRTRNRLRVALASALAKELKAAFARNEGSPATARNVTWIGQRASWSHRATCEGPVPRCRGRPAPVRAPPHPWQDGRSSCLVAGQLILNWQCCHRVRSSPVAPFRGTLARGILPGCVVWWRGSSS
ncbi:MAG: hypothetical protein JWM82_2651 [Myxococcales bacterium]|nr:hypothetical protein [Myxococcales bacterium]